MLCFRQKKKSHQLIKKPNSVGKTSRKLTEMTDEREEEEKKALVIWCWFIRSLKYCLLSLLFTSDTASDGNVIYIER